MQRRLDNNMTVTKNVSRTSTLHKDDTCQVWNQSGRKCKSSSLHKHKRDRTPDRPTDRPTDQPPDTVTPIYPPNFVCGGIKIKKNTIIWKKAKARRYKYSQQDMAKVTYSLKKIQKSNSLNKIKSLVEIVFCIKFTYLLASLQKCMNILKTLKFLLKFENISGIKLHNIIQIIINLF